MYSSPPRVFLCSFGVPPTYTFLPPDSHFLSLGFALLKMCVLPSFRAFLVAQKVKHLPAMEVRSLSWEDPLEKAVATHSSTLAWKIPWTESVHAVEKSRTRLSNFTFFLFVSTTCPLLQIILNILAPPSPPLSSFLRVT